MCNLDLFAVTFRLSVGTTPTMEKRAFFGFQHWEQPQAWLWRTLDLMVISILSWGQRHFRVPPVKLGDPFLILELRRGWRVIAIVEELSVY